MKKVLSLTLALLMVLSFCQIAFAAEEPEKEFNPKVTINDTGTSITVVIEDESGLIKEKHPTISVPCDYTRYKVSCGGNELSASYADGEVSFVINNPGTYIITKLSSDSGSSVSPAAESVKPVVELSTVVSDGKASSEIDYKQIEAALKAADKDKPLEIRVKAADGAVETAVVFEANALNDLAQSGNNAAVIINTENGRLKLKSEVIKEVLSQSGGEKLEISFSVKGEERVKEIAALDFDAALKEAAAKKDGTKHSKDAFDNALCAEFNIKAGDKNITSFGGNAIDVFVPAGSHHTEGKIYRAFIISSDGSIEASFAVIEDGAAKVSMKHFSSVVVTTEECLPFLDINPQVWFASAVTRAYLNGIVQGDNNRFDPYASFTRAMLVTILYNLEGKPETKIDTPFIDVASNLWYSNALKWAYQNKIINGKDSTHFDPNDEITREEAALMLYNFALYKGYDAAKSNELTAYTDCPEISAWALNALKWANASGIMIGHDNKLMPKATATRSEATVLVLNFEERFVMLQLK